MALYTGCQDQFIPDQVKNQRLQPFLPPGTGVNPDPPKGGEDKLYK